MDNIAKEFKKEIRYMWKEIESILVLMKRCEPHDFDKAKAKLEDLLDSSEQNVWEIERFLCDM